MGLSRQSRGFADPQEGGMKSRATIALALLVLAPGGCGGSDGGEGRYVVDDIVVRKHILSEVRFDARWVGGGSPPESQACRITVSDEAGEVVGRATTTIAGDEVDDVYTTVDVTGTPDTAKIECY
jgi:hypothetical protein